MNSPYTNGFGLPLGVQSADLRNDPNYYPGKLGEPHVHLAKIAESAASVKDNDLKRRIDELVAKSSDSMRDQVELYVEWFFGTKDIHTISRLAPYFTLEYGEMEMKAGNILSDSNVESGYQYHFSQEFRLRPATHEELVERGLIDD